MPRPDDKGERATTKVARRIIVIVLVIALLGMLFGAFLLRDVPWWALLFGPPALFFACLLVIQVLDEAPAAGDPPKSLDDSDDYFDANPYGF